MTVPLSYLNFCPEFFDHAGKWLDRKARFNLKIYDAIKWEINKYNNTYNTYIKK